MSKFLDWSREVTLCGRLFLLTVMAWSWCVPTGAQEVSAVCVQRLIDEAVPGSVVIVPAGTYSESIVLKDGVTLVGEGADKTILDGGGSNSVVSMADGSILMGVTVRNGDVGIWSDGQRIGIFECSIMSNVQFGIYLAGARAVVANNTLYDNDRGDFSGGVAHARLAGNSFEDKGKNVGRQERNGTGSPVVQKGGSIEEYRAWMRIVMPRLGGQENLYRRGDPTRPQCCGGRRKKR